MILTSQDALDRWLDTSTQTWDSKLNRLLGPYNDSDTPLEWYALVPRFNFLHSLTPTLTHSHIHTHITHICGWLVENSYAVPKEVGKVGVQSPTFIEPVQKRKDGIGAMFSRQTQAAQQQKSASRDTPPTAAAGSSKRKREPSSPTEEKGEEETGTLVPNAAPSSPAKRSKVKKKDPIKHEDSVDSEGNSDIEILPSDPSSSQPQSVGPPTSYHYTELSYE